MTARTASKLGWWSIALAAVPWVFVVIAVAFYFEQPPPLSGFAGVGWFFGMMGSLFLLAMGTYTLAPISIALGALGLVAMSRTAAPNRARAAAVAGMVISFFTLASVATGHVIPLRRAAAISAAHPANDSALIKRPIVEQRVRRLVEACRAYATANNDRFSADMNVLAQWSAQNGRPLDPNRPQDFEYYGAGALDLTRNPTADDIANASRLILFFEKVPIVKGARVIGFDSASAYTASALSVQETDLPLYERASNDERVRRGPVPATIALPVTN
jgi:hypothetical protein